jgi:hypothetical protein
MAQPFSFQRADSLVTSTVAGIDTSYSTSRVHEHALMNGILSPTADSVRIVIKTLTVWLSSVSGATKFYVKLCLDPNLDYAIIPETEVEPTFGTTTSTVASCVIDFSQAVRNVVGNTNSYYLAVRTDTGTATLTRSLIMLEV